VEDVAIFKNQKRTVFCCSQASGIFGSHEDDGRQFYVVSYAREPHGTVMSVGEESPAQRTNGIDVWHVQNSEFE